MNPYSEDLRKKIVEAIKHGTPKTEAARSFGVSRSSVKRYAAMAREGKSLTPKKRPGSKPKLDVGAKRLLEADLEQRPAATLSERREYLERVAGAKVSESTVSRMLKRMGWSRKKDGGCERARGVPKGCLEGVSCLGDGREALRRGAEARRFVFLRTRGAPTFRCCRSTPGRARGSERAARESERAVQRHATGGREHYAPSEHKTSGGMGSHAWPS